MPLKSIPIYGSLYPEPPYIYHGTHLILTLFNVDKKILAEANIIPEGLQLAGGKKTTVMAFFANYVKSSIGQYYEAATLIDVKYQSEKYGKVRGFYCNSMFVDKDSAMAAGREIWGFPKKLAKIQLIEKGDQVIGTLERRNIEIMKMTIDLENEVAELPMPDIPIINFRQFFAPGGGDYSLRQFQKIPMELETDTIKSGSLKLEFNPSEEDPLSIFESGSDSIALAVFITLKRGVLPWGILL